MSDRAVTEVAVGVVINPEDGSYLLGSRPEGKPYAGYWEFPGGKIEAGESVHEALAREMREELDLNIISSRPWFVHEHSYPHAYVRLHFRVSENWKGEPKGLESQQFAWFDSVNPPMDMRLLPAVELICKRAELPEVIAQIDDASDPGVVTALQMSGAQAILCKEETALLRSISAKAGIALMPVASQVLQDATVHELQEESAQELLFATAEIAVFASCDEKNRLPVYIKQSLAGAQNCDIEQLRNSGAHGVIVCL